MNLLLGFVLSQLVLLSSAQETCPARADGNSCDTEPEAIKKATKDMSFNHYYIGGLFGVHNKGSTAYQCDSSLRLRGVMNLQAFLWAIQHYETTLPPDISVGGVAFDNCLSKDQAIGNVMGFEQCRLKPTNVDRRQLLAFVGPDTSTEALAIGALASDLKVPFISHAATSPELSDAQKYPYFLRTVPSDAHDVNIMMDVLSGVLNAKHVQLIYMDNDYGRAGMEEFKRQADEKDICIAQTIKINADVSDAASSPVVAKLRENRAVKFVVLLADANTAKRVLSSVSDFNKGVNRDTLSFIFFGTSSWGASEVVLQGNYFVANNSIVPKLTVPTDYKAAVNQFKSYWDGLKPTSQGPNIKNEFLSQYWEQEFNCKFDVAANEPCDVSRQSLSDKELDPYVPYTIMAVHMIMKGVENASMEQCGRAYRLCSDFLNLNNRGAILFTGIKGVKTSATQYFFDQTRSTTGTGYVSTDPSSAFTKYDVFHMVKDKFQKFSDYTPGTGLTNQQSLDLRQYTSSCPYPCEACGEKRTTLPPTSPPTTQPPTTTPDPTAGSNYTSVRFPIGQQLTGAYFSSPRDGEMWMTRFEIGQKWIIALGVLAGLGILAVIIFEIYILYKLLGTRMGSRWRTMWLGQLLLFGIFLSFLTLFAFIPIPTKATCGITRIGVGLSYSIMFAVLLVKLMVILTSKTSDASLLPGDMDSPNYLKGIYQFLMFMFAVGVQVVIDAQWLITVPPEAVLVSSNNGGKVWICNHYTWRVSDGMFNMTSFVRNEFENHLLSLVYIMFLILITTVLALNAHGIITNHRESIFIGISAGFSIPIWLAWGLVGGLNRAHPYAQEFGDACIALGLFLTATLILFAMFLPKVRQLVNIGVEGIYFEDDRDTYYAGSVIMSPPSYKSKPNSVIYVNSGGLYSEPVVVGNGDPTATHLKHPGQPGPMSTYSAPPGFMKRSDTGSKVLRVTPDLTGKHPTERKRPQSEYAYVSRSVKGTLKRSRSNQNIGAL